jgi:filamentous hemagglutinin family protein
MHSLFRTKSGSRRAWLLMGVSAIAIAASSGANARPLGVWSTSAATTAAAAAQAAAQQAQQAAQSSQQSLTRATQAIQALKAAQAAARGLAASAPSGVPDGLAIGGLVPDSGLASTGVANAVTSWSGANTPTQTTGNGQTTVTVDQTQASALLNWQSFNISRNTTLNIDQHGNTSWSALNKVAAGIAPSQILGAIKADGEVYVINQNGIIFGGTSQINVHTLIASTLDLTPSLATGNYQQYLANGLYSIAIPTGFTGSGAAVFNQGSSGKVVVQAGAQIDTTGNLSGNGDGGYVALLGSGGVSNAGSIITQNGQIILAAGSSVTLITPTSGVVGVKTALQVITDGSAPVSNAANALLIANDGAVTLAGGQMTQFGAIEATTSTSRTGSIGLSSFDDIVLGPDSLTAILPDETSSTLLTSTVNSTTTLNGANDAPYFQTVLQPKITILAAGSVDVQGHGSGLGGAFIKAPGAAVTISGDSAQGSVLLESGSTVDVSGLAGVTLPMSVNQVNILVTQAEVADDPLAAALIGKTVSIDARLSGTRADGFRWVGSPLLDAAGFVGNIPQSIDQILTAGGSFTTSAKNVVQMPGSTINVSAGYVQYTGGMISTTRLLGSDGRIYDIGSANPNLSYTVLSGFTVDHAHWGVTEIYASLLGGGTHYESGYIAGANGGAINVTATAPVLDGDVVATVVAGSRQRALAGSSNVAAADKMPNGASLNVNLTAGGGTAYDVALEARADAGADPYGLAGLSFANASTWTPTLANGLFPIFSDVLSSVSFGSISITGAHTLSMSTDAVLSVRPGGSITLDNVATIDGTLSAPSGSISLTGFTYPIRNRPQTPPVAALVIGSHAVLDVHGLWVNDSGLTGDEVQGAGFVNGGSVSISTIAASDSATTNGDGVFTDVTQSIVLAPGSVIDVSGGGYVGTTGKLKSGSDGLPVGKGGSLSLITYAGGFSGTIASDGNGFNVLPHGTDSSGTKLPNQANLILGGTIYADGLDGGGTLTLQVSAATIDAAATEATSYISSDPRNLGWMSAAGTSFVVSDARAGELVLPPSFFISGFSQIVLGDIHGGTKVTSGTVVTPRQTNAIVTAGLLAAPTGALARNFAAVGLLPDGLRQPTSLTLTSRGGGGVLVDHGAEILADAQATVSLVSSTVNVLTSINIYPDVTVFGKIVASGGTINVLGDTSSGQGTSEVWIGADAVLDVSGAFQPNPQVVGYSTGKVLDAGTITLSANAVKVQSGAEFELRGAAVSAASGLIQLAPRDGGQDAWSNGGNLQLAGNNLYFAGGVDAAGGDPRATGGSLTIGNFAPPSVLASSTIMQMPSVLVIEQAGIVAGNMPGQGVTPTKGGFIGADTLSNSGFDSVTLNAGQTVAFGGSVDVTVPGALTLYAGLGHVVLLPSSGGLLPAGVSDPAAYTAPSCGTTSCVASIGGTTVNLNAGYVRLVGSINATTLAAPKLADGTLNVSAKWIDLEGALALDNVANAAFVSASAIRLLPQNYGFVGTVDTTNLTTFTGAMLAPGNLTLKAAEVYPATDTQFLLASTGTLDSYSTLTILPNGQATAPLSAGGAVVLSARTVDQEGTLWAPLGNIVVGTPSQMPAAISTFLGGTAAPTLVSTDTVTLGKGSLTSVSAAGLVLPFGFTVDDSTWDAGPAHSTSAPVLSAPPSKTISINGANVTTSEGAVLDLSGGGDIYATEFVAGNGGSRNVLTSYQQNPSTGAYSSTYSDGRQVYALVPAYEAPVAAYDPMLAQYPYYSGVVVPPGAGTTSSTRSYANGLTPGQSVTIGAGSDIPAGTYVLLPGMYATLPGAYRVVQVASNVNPATTRSSTSVDGSQYIVGTLGNTLTGASSSQSALFQLQSQSVWSKYSQINITSGTTFFRNQALAAGQNPPLLPIDGGTLVLAATQSLNLNGTNLFAPGTSLLAPGLVGGGGQVQIGGSNILVLASDQAMPAADCLAGSAPGCTGQVNYLKLDADQISNLGASSVLIGGTASVVGGVETITASALNLEVKTDAAHALTGPELILVSLAPDSVDPAKRGIVVDAGSVISAKGAVPAGTSRNITIGALPVAQFKSDGTPKLDSNGNQVYSGQASGDGALLRVSNGGVVNVTRLYVPGQYSGPGPQPAATAPLGSFSIGAGAIIDGGNALTLDTSGSGTLASDAVLKAANFDIASSVINIGGGSSGLVLTSTVLQNFADATSVRLRSASVINLYDANGLQIGDAAHPVGTLTFDSAGLYSQGGTTTVDALNVVLTDSQSTPNLTGALQAPATGRLIINAGTDGTTLFGAGTFTEASGAVVLGNFSNDPNVSGVTVHASQAIGFSGAGSLGTTFNIAGVAVSSTGSGYTSVPTVSIAGGNGTDATATASLGVVSIAVTAGGSGYASGAAVTVTGPDGSNFKGTAIVDGNGAIVGVNITQTGSGFTGAISSVSVDSAAGGSGANLTASLGVVGVTVANAGAGYASNPTFTFSGGGGTGTAAQAVAGGGASIKLSAPEIIVNNGATQTLTTSGNVTLASGIGTAPASVATNIGGALTITGASITDSATIQALSGNVSMTATGTFACPTCGDLTLGAGALIKAGGSEIAILDIVDDAPAGNVRLTSAGNVTIAQGATVDVSSAGLGYAGSLAILAVGDATLGGTLNGQAAFNDIGGSFSLQTGGQVFGALPFGSFTSGFAVRQGKGDINIGVGQVLTSTNVLLVAATGSVIVDGTIDASGPTGGAISLYGATAVQVGKNAPALLRAAYQADDPRDPAYGNGTSALVQTGGTITLGTTGTPDGSVNATYGYQNVTSSGAISVAAGSVLDVSGGAGGANINNAGGSIIIRAPILFDNTVNVDFRGTVRGVVDGNGNATGKGIVLNAFAVWSTTDSSTGAHHFDGIIDPAGWFDDNGNPLSGKDQNGVTILAPTPSAPLATGKIFTVGTANPDHVGFYQTTLANFVENFSLSNSPIAAGIGNVHLRPEIDLINPSATINHGNITVASNWNLGAGSLDSSGNVSLVYRTTNGKEPGTVGLFARNNININATITDGFFTNYDASSSGGATDAMSLYNSEEASTLYHSYLCMFSGCSEAGNLQYDSSGTTNLLAAAFGLQWSDLGLNAPVNPQNPSASFFGLSTSDYNALGLQFILKKPDYIGGLDTTAIDQFNQYYAVYLTLFRAYENELIAVNSKGVNAFGVSVSGGIVLSYSDYINSAPSLFGSLQIDPTTIQIPTVSTTVPSYSLTAGLGSISFNGFDRYSASTNDYATQWTAYLFNVINLNIYNGKSFTLSDALNGAKPTLSNTTTGLEYANGVFAAIAVTPPAPPPAYTTTASDYVSSLTTTPAHPADLIANNPAIYRVTGKPDVTVYNTTSASQLMSAAVSGQGSFSYDIVAGAAFTGSNALSVDPNAVVANASLSPTVTGNVTIDGHTSYPDALKNGTTINIPTLVRTGTGSITIAAAGNVELLDQVTPGAVYTAGAAIPTPSDFNAPAVPAAYTSNPNGLVSTPAWATGGGAVSVTAGGSIIGIEMPTDSNGSQTGIVGAGTGQLWSDWYVHYGQSDGSANPFEGCAAAGSQACQTAAWVNYATFFQGFGALGGGNITLTAGADIVDVGASLPETLVVSGGTGVPDANGNLAPVAHYYGGGNLRVTAGGNLLSSDFLVGRGTGLIQVGGSAQATTSNPLNQGKPTQAIQIAGTATTAYTLPLLLAVQDGFVTVNARGAITLGNVFDPASVPLDASVQTPNRFLPGAVGTADPGFGSLFTSYGPDSGVALTSLTGDVTALTFQVSQVAGLFVHNPSIVSTTKAVGKLLPATLDVTALSGDITVNKTGQTDTGFGNLMSYPTQAGDDVGTLSLVAAGSIDLGAGLTMSDYSVSATQFVGSSSVDSGNYISPLGVPLPNLTLALHANDPNPVIIAAGIDVDATNATGNAAVATLSLNKPAKIEAGNNVTFGTRFTFTGENNNATDITSITAGNDLVGGSYMLYGPGTLILQAGHDMGPFTKSVSGTSPSTGGIMTIGNGSALGTSFLRPYLPAQGAEIDVLFGVKPGIDYAAAISSYVDPAHAGSGGIDFLADIASILGQSRDQAWATFQTLPQARQQLLVNRAFLDLLTQVGKDAKDPTSQYFGQYARAYAAISALFPAGLGYTDNRTGSGNGAAALVSTGKLNIAKSVLETQMGGDINILGPGGGITVGTNSADDLAPNQEGILTLGGGSIRAFTDGSIAVNQSRIMTEQGGDIGLFSANGDISAGSGPKTFASSPTLSEICTVGGYCYVNPQGLVTGAGIAALLTLPGQDPSKSNVTLVAPHGTIDVGSAGLRGTNITLAALTVLNAFNIQAAGTVTGLTFTPPPNIGALTTASNANTATQQAGQPTQNQPTDRPSIIIVEVVGYGEGGGTGAPPPPSSGTSAAPPPPPSGGTDTSKPANDDNDKPTTSDDDDKRKRRRRQP